MLTYPTYLCGQDVQGFEGRRRMLQLQRNVDHLDSCDVDLHELPVSSWASLWQQRMQQKRQAECVETNDAKRRRISHEASSRHDMYYVMS